MNPDFSVLKITFSGSRFLETFLFHLHLSLFLMFASILMKYYKRELFYLLVCLVMTALMSTFKKKKLNKFLVFSY